MEKKNLFVGIDIGTQSVKSILCDEKGSLICEVSTPSNLIIENDITAYEDANIIFDHVLSSIKKLIINSGINANDIKAIGIDSQMAGIMAIDKDFNPVGPYDSWIDVRCSKYTDILKEKLGDKGLANSGAQYMHSHASKILWRKYERPEEYKKIAKFTQLSSFISGKLCDLSIEEAYVDSSYIHFNCFGKTIDNSYDYNLLNMFDIDASKMPKIISSLTIIGSISKKYKELLGATNDIKVIAGCGDTTASSIGAGIIKPQLAYDIAGTASVFACATDKFVPDIKNHTMLFSKSVFDNLYLSLAYITGGGMCLNWFSKITGKNLEELNELAKDVNPDNNLIFIPHFNGRSFPLDNDIRGAFVGLTLGTTIGEMYHAILESIAYEYRIYRDILVSSSSIKNIDAVYGVGGGAKSPLFCQIKADILVANYMSVKNVNSAPLAVALLAAKACGYLTKDFEDIFSVTKENAFLYVPNLALKECYTRKFETYKKVLKNYAQII